MDLNLHVAIHPSLVRWLQQQKKEEASCGEEDLAREEGRENKSRAPGDSSRKKDTRIQSRKDRFQRIFIKSHAHSHMCVSQTTTACLANPCACMFMSTMHHQNGWGKEIVTSSQCRFAGVLRLTLPLSSVTGRLCTVSHLFTTRLSSHVMQAESSELDTRDRPASHLNP